MPYAPADGVTYLVGKLILERDSSFADVRVIRYYETTTTVEMHGVFSLQGDSVRFTSVSYRAPFSMRWTEGALTARWDDGLFVYRR